MPFLVHQLLVDVLNGDDKPLPLVEIRLAIAGFAKYVTRVAGSWTGEDWRVPANKRQQTGHANEVSSSFNVFLRVSRLLSLVVRRQPDWMLQEGVYGFHEQIAAIRQPRALLLCLLSVSASCLLPWAERSHYRVFRSRAEAASWTASIQARRFSSRNSTPYDRLGTDHGRRCIPRVVFYFGHFHSAWLRPHGGGR